MYQFKAKDSEIKPYSLCLDNISKDFTLDSLKKKELKGIVKVFSVNYTPINTSNFLDIHRFLMKEMQYEIMFGIVKKCLLYYYIA